MDRKMTTKLPQGIRRHTTRSGYEVRITVKDEESGQSKRISSYALTIAEAKRKKSEMEIRAQAGQFPVDSAITLASWSHTWLEQILPLKGLKPGTLDLYGSLLRKHILSSSLSRMRLADIRPFHIGVLLKKLSEEKGSSLLRNVYAILTHIFRDAMQNRLIAQSPVREVKRPRQVKPKVRFISDSELDLLRSQMSNSKHALPFELILQTGLRRGEALGLSWKDIDFDRKQLHVRFSLDAKKRRTSPKTHNGVRTIDLNDAAILTLRRAKSAQAQDRLTLGNTYASIDWMPVFTHQSGAVLCPRAFLRSVQDAARKAGIAEGEGVERIGVHTLRHYVASKLLNAGVQMLVVSRILGHDSIQTTVDIYGHIEDSSRRSAMSLLA